MEKLQKQDLESGRPSRIPYFTQVFDQGAVTPEVINHPYDGSGTEDDPYVVTWLPDDPRNPQQFSPVKKWSFVMIMALATFAVAFVSSEYSGGFKQIIEGLHASEEVTILGVSLYVVGFAVGPLAWAPLSGELGSSRSRGREKLR